ncbi:channel protein, hemolysin III family [Anaeromyxobacter dehalogenans 2CP-1]|uniref:Channel protein, hemolysin III family n=1 Tax=Anaeromyxobacter dehalogenans (strain ATCC BAA-258 / DSM 21875 / 2CP-1) TaxID=455488 RepID=B8JGF6_ANAD2|nr:hemolysin III family protein [Anaeromyxobacter dehalogenans]ACL64627.1 channel protein, hemolysin III family [Anaeromyxobacter dehalogenans 2CP-1]
MEQVIDPTVRPGKPLLRGVSHEIAASISLAAWVAVALTAPPGRASVAAHVYGASLFTLFAVSALYHRPMWPPGPRLLMRRLDHSAIFLLIAGTYTPMCLLLGEKGTLVLALVWTGAVLGIFRAVLWPRAPRWLSAALYVLLGWLILPLLPAVARAAGTGGLVLLGLGGLVYSLGAVVYATKRPNPFPGVFGYHEVFHAMVVAAAALHFAVVLGALRRIG